MAKYWALGLSDLTAIGEPHEIEGEARHIVRANFELFDEVGAAVCPMWECIGGRAHTREVERSSRFERRYFSGRAREALELNSVIRVVAFAAHRLARDIPRAANALQDTHDLWRSSRQAMLIPGVAWTPHTRLVSLLLADIARKVDAGFSVLEWLASVHIAVEELIGSTNASAEQVRDNAIRLTAEMRGEEEEWTTLDRDTVRAPRPRGFRQR